MTETRQRRREKTAWRTLKNAELSPGIYSLELEYPGEDFPEIMPGQFVGVYPKGESMILPRPISVCSWNREQRCLRLVYRAAGRGTAEMSSWRPGDTADILGILGNGYDISLLEGKKVFLLGGGIGIPPMLGLAACLEGRAEVTSILGYRDGALFLQEEFRQFGCVETATQDGAAGYRGTVLDALRQCGAAPDVICACGPVVMLRAVKEYAAEQGIPCYISLEERMACGIGVCLGCVCGTKDRDAHSHVHNTRVCTEGPVFNAEEVEI